MNTFTCDWGVRPLIILLPCTGAGWDGAAPDRAVRQTLAAEREPIGRLGHDLALTTGAVLLENRMSRLWCDVTRSPDGRDDGAVPPHEGNRAWVDPKLHGERMTVLYRPWRAMIHHIVHWQLEAYGSSTVVELRGGTRVGHTEPDYRVAGGRAAEALTQSLLDAGRTVGSYRMAPLDLPAGARQIGVAVRDRTDGALGDLGEALHRLDS